MNKIVLLSALTIVIIGTIVSASESNPTTVDLIAGGDQVVGNVSVWNDTNTLYVTYTITNESWCINETHLHIANESEYIPQTKKGNPMPGQFDNSTDFTDHGCTDQVEYTIPIPEDCGEYVIIAAHAAVQLESDGTITNESAWGDGTDFNDDRNWAMYINYTLINTE